MPDARRIRTIIVDDDPDDRRLLAEAMQEAGCHYELVMLNDGLELIEYLQQGATSADAAESLATLIILDLNMPRMNGFDTLRLLKSDFDLKTVPVVVMSTSKSQKDVAECYRLGAASFISKPISFMRLVEAVSSIARYWGELVEFPDPPSR